MICKRCGANNPNGTMFCENCGAEMNEYRSAYPEVPEKGKGIAGMILGILSLELACGCVGLPVAIIGLILSNSSSNAARAVGMENKFSKVGKILNAIGIGLSIVSIIFWIVYFVLIVGLTASGY